MKKYLAISILALACIGITSCSQKYCMPNGTCWRENFVNGPCGTKIQQRCEKICRYCKFRDASCEACWKCVNHDSMCHQENNSH